MRDCALIRLGADMIRYLILISLLFTIGFVFAQDSTFVSKYTIEGDPWDFYCGNDVAASNVIVKYDGKFALQSLAINMTPPPEEWITFQSPIFNVNNDGTYEDYVLGPMVEMQLINAYYASCFPDRSGGYLALSGNNEDRILHSLDSTFQFSHMILNYDDNNIQIFPIRLYEEQDGYIITGLQRNPERFVCAKYNYSHNIIWKHTFIDQVSSYSNCPSLALTSDLSYLFWSPQMRLMKVSNAGDSLWNIDYNNAPYYNLALIEQNDILYGARYHYNPGINQRFIQILRYHLDSTQLDTLYSFPILHNVGEPSINAKFLHLSDNSILLTTPLATGQLHKFDANMSLLWSSNLVQYPLEDRATYVGLGRNPTREMPNGDLLTCLWNDLWNDNSAIYLIRTDPVGHVIANDDAVQVKPKGNSFSVYPNPFFSSIKITANKKLPLNTSLKIFNIKGQLVKSNKIELERTEWIPKNLASGIYFMQFNVAGRAFEIHKILFMK